MFAASSYGGMAGETIRQFVRPGTLLTTIPTLIVTAILGLAAQWLCNQISVPPPFSWLALLIALSPVYGRFGLAARGGDVESGFIDAGGAPGLGVFVLRYGALSLAWGVPLGLLGMALLRRSGIGLVMPSAGSGSASAGMLSLAMVIFLVSATLLPTLSLIIALSCDSVSEVFQAERWHWLFVERRHDLPAFYAATIGGMALFYGVSVPALLALDVLLLAVSTQTGLMLAPFVLVLPAAATPILMGRLAGAFAFANESMALAAQQSAPSLAPVGVPQAEVGGATRCSPQADAAAATATPCSSAGT